MAYPDTDSHVLMSRRHGLLSANLDYLNGQVERAATVQVSVADIKARFTAIARLADAGQEVIITNRGRPAYRLLPIIPVPLRSAFPNTTALAMQSKPSQTLVNGSFVADWRAQNERF